MELIPHSQLEVKDRQRKHFDEKRLRALADSIADKGLLHAPVIESEGTKLIAGERRIRAIMILHEEKKPVWYSGMLIQPGFIPAVRVGTLSAYSLEEAQLEENLLREDLTPVEEAQAIARLHRLREAQKAEIGEKQTLQETVDEILETSNKATWSGAVSNALIIDEHSSDPEVAAAKSQREAMKIIKRKEEARHHETIAGSFDPSVTRHNIKLGNCISILSEIPEASFDVLCTDPPYGVGADTFGDMADARHEYSDSRDDFIKLMGEFLPEAHRVLKRKSHIFHFCDFQWFEYLSFEYTLRGFSVYPRPLIWYKGSNVGMVPLPEHGPRQTYECILFAYRGDRTTNSIFPDVIDTRGLMRPRFGAEKPALLFYNLLSTVTRPGDKVLDPFAGAGPIIPAANDLNLTVTTCELSEEKYNYSLTRLKDSAIMEIVDEKENSTE